MHTELDNAIYEKYILPTKRKSTRRVGVELELPIVNIRKQAVNFTVVHELTKAFTAKFDFCETLYDDEGHIYNALNSKNGDSLSYDCSYNTLELSFGTEENLNILYQRFVVYYTFINDFLKPHKHMLTGMGVNPYHKLNNNVPIPTERYRMLYRHLSSYKKYEGELLFHDNPNFGMFSCASQVQLDVEDDTVTEVINTFTMLEPLKTLLFANSPWDNEWLCVRDYFWRASLHGLNRHNVDMYDIELQSLDELAAYIKSMSIYCAERNGKYINFPPTVLEQYFSSPEIEGEYYDGNGCGKIAFTPRLDDLSYLRSFKFVDLTFRGTIEFRSVCAQPIGEVMGFAAFHAGLIENLSELSKLLHSDNIIYHKGYNASELRALFNKRALPPFADTKKLSVLLCDILEIAKDGLKKRGLFEESFLEPLRSRARHIYSPAREMTDGIDTGVPIEYYIDKFSQL